MQDFNQFPNNPKPIDWIKVFQILLCVLAVILILYLWNRMLYYKNLVIKYQELFDYLRDVIG